MKRTKIVIALVAVAAIGMVTVGVASAQIAAFRNTTTNPTIAPNDVPNPGFWGWVGRCFGFDASQPYANPYLAPLQQALTNTSIPVPAAPYQGGYGRGYGYGPCWTR